MSQAFTRTSIENWTSVKLHEMTTKALTEVEHQVTNLFSNYFLETCNYCWNFHLVLKFVIFIIVAVLIRIHIMSSVK